MTTISKNIPIPPYAPEKYPFNGLRLMESFFVAADSNSDRDLRLLQWRLCACAKSRKAKKFTTRTVTENEQRGVRVWRVQ